jgi:hypothetical protein
MNTLIRSTRARIAALVLAFLAVFAVSVVAPAVTDKAPVSSASAVWGAKATIGQVNWTVPVKNMKGYIGAYGRGAIINDVDSIYVAKNRALMIGNNVYYGGSTGKWVKLWYTQNYYITDNWA